MVSATELDRLVTIYRRVAVPGVVGQNRGGFAQYGNPIWGGFKEVRARDQGEDWGLKLGVLTIRDNSWARTISSADRVRFDDDDYDIKAVSRSDREGVIRLDLQMASSSETLEPDLEQRAETVTLRRVVPGGPNIDKTIRAKVEGYKVDELVGGIRQGDRKVTLLAADVVASGFPLPLRAGSTDRIILSSGRMLTIEVVDESTHRVAGETIAYEITARG